MTDTAAILAATQRHGSLAADRAYRAIDLACAVHHGEHRQNGDPYIVHPLAVASIVAELGADPDTIAAALLHDVVDDADYPLDKIRAEFGDTVAQILHEFVQLNSATLDLNDADRHINELSRFARRAVTVKLADRLHNMQTISGLTEDKQHLKARETCQVLAPVARAVGLGEIAVELDALSADTLRRPRSARPAPVVRPWTSEAGLRHARTLLHLGARLLMPQSSRDRWLAEWDGEINALSDGHERFRFTLGLVIGLPRMAAAAHRSALARNVTEDRP